MADKSRTAPGQDPEFKALYDRLKLQQDQIDQCRIMMERMVSANANDSYLQNGIVQMCAAMEPLRMVFPPRAPLEQADAERFMVVRAALKRPDYASFRELPISACEPGYGALAHQSRSSAA